MKTIYRFPVQINTYWNIKCFDLRRTEIGEYRLMIHLDRSYNCSETGSQLTRELINNLNQSFNLNVKWDRYFKANYYTILYNYIETTNIQMIKTISRELGIKHDF